MRQALIFLRRYIDRVWHSRFASNVAVVATGTAAAQAITVAFAPLITRIYGPEAFGLLGIFVAILSISTPVAALAYPIAIVLPRDDRDALSLVRLSAILSFMIAVLAAAALWAGGDWLTVTIGAVSIASYLFLIPLAMLFSAWVQIAQQWLIRKQEFRIVARCAVEHSFVLNSATSGIGWLNPVGAMLILLATLGYALNAGLLIAGAYRQFKGIANERTLELRTTLLELAYRYRDFPLYRAPQIFINAASWSLPVLILAAFFGPVAAGFFTLSKMVLGLFGALFGKAFSDSFYPRLVKAYYAGENLHRHIVRATVVFFAIGVVPFALITFFGPSIFSLVFGREWTISGEYARWLAILFFFNFIAVPSVAAVPVLGIQRGLLVYELISTATKLLGLAVGTYWFGSDIWTVALFSIIGAGAYGLMILWILSRAMSRSRDKPSKEIRPTEDSVN